LKRWASGRRFEGAQSSLPHSYRKNLEEKILLVAQTLIYHSHTIQHFDTEGGGVFMATKKAAKKPAKKAAKKKK
jgi:hypothetical protein